MRYVGGMRMQLRGGARDQIPAALPPNRAAWQARWLELTVTLVAAAVIAAVCLTTLWPSPLALAPLLAVPPALAGIGASTVLAPARLRRRRGGGRRRHRRRPQGRHHGHDRPRTSSPWPPPGRWWSRTVLGVAGAVVGDRRPRPSSRTQQEQQIANMTSVAEAAQRAVLRPLPEQLGPLKLGVVYLAAAAEARVGGDLYEVTLHRDARHPADHRRRARQGTRRGRGGGGHHRPVP